MTCPNSDPNFDKVLSKIVDSTKDYPKKRKYLFYFICVIVRYLLYSYIYFNIDKTYIVIIAGLLSLFSMYNLYKNIGNTRQWWSKKFQLLISILVFISCIIVLFNLYQINRKIIPILLFISLFGGFFQSLFIEFC
jgi:hypothetical protein